LRNDNEVVMARTKISGGIRALRPSQALSPSRSHEIKPVLARVSREKSRHGSEDAISYRSTGHDLEDVDMARAPPRRFSRLNPLSGGILEEFRRFPMLERREDFMLAKRWRERGDREAVHRLVTSHLRLVTKIAMGCCRYGLPITEVISEGNVGLMKAVKRFEPEKGFLSRPVVCGGSGRRSRKTSCSRGRC
jgi:DNA-directed RNA polymerase sigma subunit (sigma70/sigma32)